MPIVEGFSSCVHISMRIVHPDDQSQSSLGMNKLNCKNTIDSVFVASVKSRRMLPGGQVVGSRFFSTSADMTFMVQKQASREIALLIPFADMVQHRGLEASFLPGASFQSASNLVYAHSLVRICPQRHCVSSHTCCCQNTIWGLWEALLMSAHSCTHFFKSYAAAVVHDFSHACMRNEA